MQVSKNEWRVAGFVAACFIGFTVWFLAIGNYEFMVYVVTMTIDIYPLFASTGLGALNELIEFSTVLIVAETGVGAYYNAALDLVFNALGALIAVLWIARMEKRA